MATRSRTTLKQKTLPSRLPRGISSVMDSLRAHDELATLMPTVTRLAAIQRDCAAFLPDLFNRCAVLRFDSGQLVLSAPHAAMASRLKQNVASLQQHLVKAGWQVSAIRFKVQPERTEMWQTHPPKTGLSPQALAAFADLAQTMEKTPRNEALKTAVQALLKRHHEQST